MRTADIADVRLRAWVEDHVAKQGKGASPGMRELWKGFTEGDWAALRRLIDLRPVAFARFGDTAVQVAIAKKVRDQPRVELNGVSYSAPYSLGLEVAALTELLGQHAPPAPPTRDPRVTVKQFTFNDQEPGEERWEH